MKYLIAPKSINLTEEETVLFTLVFFSQASTYEAQPKIETEFNINLTINCF